MEIVEELSCEFVQEAKLEHRESCNEVWEPKIGLLFDSEIAALKIYDTFAKRQGFGVITISTRKLNGVRHNVTYGCNRSRKYKPRGSNVIRILSTTKTDCPARINIVMMPDGRWRLNSFVIDHNHEFDIEAAKYLKSNRTLQPHVQREIEFNRDVGLRMNKTVSSATRQTGGPENLMWIEKDAQNHLDKVRRHELQGGDVQVMLSFFAKQQAENEDFYYAIDVDEFGCLARVFWADSRSREAYKWFGDVITFDTTYLVNQFDVPFAPFVGVNHHRMTILLGCGLVVQEDTDSFVWLFEQWLACMGGCHPSAIITDQDRAMQNAIAHVFPNTRHRWCLWHIMKKIPEKLKSYKEYKSIKSQLKNVVYDSLTTQEFEEGWQCFIDHYDLQDNGWLSSMYEERRRWIPAYVKDTFWAGMSTTQRSESLNAFFDGYVHSKTCLREFVEQYENVLLKKVMQEEEQDANCKNRQKYNLSPYGFESQFQQAYTIAIFTIFLKQVGDLIGSHLTMGELKDDIREYFVEQDILVGKEHVFKTVNLIVHFNEESKDTNCTCRMFESVGIPCTHMICIWKNKKLTTVPDKYILHRWRKDMVRSHTKMKVSYSNWQTKPEWRRYDCLKRKFNKGVDQVIHSEKMSVWLDGKLDDIIQEAKAIRMVGENTEAVGANVGGSSASNKMPTLEEYGTNLTKLAEEGKLDPVVGRQEQIERVTQILGRRTKNNPCLIGEPGVGKTAIAEGLAQRIANGDVPETIEGKKVITLDMGLLVAGTKYRGESEERLKKLMEEVRQSDEIILFIDEVHTLIWAGPAANLLKPALARGELQCIGATTLDEYRTHIEKDPALERRFQPVKVPEPTVDETVQILKGLRERYEIHHKLRYTDAALVAAAELSHQYINDRFLPDKAIDLVDEAGSRVRLRHARLPEDARELEKELRQITKEKNEAVRSQDFEKASELRDREIDLKTQISVLVEKNKEMSKAENEVGDGGPVVTEADIQQIVSSWTGVPVEKVSTDESERLLKLEETLHKRIIGQDEAVVAVSRAIRRARVGLKDPNRPIASFIFSGPTGVGKSELAKALAAYYFGSEEAMIRLDMSEFMERHTVSKLIGSPPGYVGYTEGGQLTEAVRRRPYTVVLFDEIEKAHPDVFNMMLQILEDGRLTDSKGRTVDFKNTLLIMTSNLGSSVIGKGPRQRFGFLLGIDGDDDEEDNQNKQIKDSVNKELKKYFRPEFLNRLDETIVFRRLTSDEIKQIARIMLTEVFARVNAKGIGIQVTEKFIGLVATEGYKPSYGARPLRRAIVRLLEDSLAEKMLSREIKEGDSVIVDVDENKHVIVLNGKGERALPTPPVEPLPENLRSA